MEMLAIVLYLIDYRKLFSANPPCIQDYFDYAFVCAEFDKKSQFES